MEPFLGQISVFGFNFAPANWATCQGQIMPISQNTALFSLLGTMYGGNGQTTFGLPDLRGNVAVGQGQALGASNYVMGEIGGVPTVTLNTTQMPSHVHSLMAAGSQADANSPEGAVLASPRVTGQTQSWVGEIYNKNPPDTVLNAPISSTGGGQPHNNLQPFLVLTYCICVRGIFPQRG